MIYRVKGFGIVSEVEIDVFMELSCFFDEQYEKQNDRILKEELPRLVSAQYAIGDQWRNNSKRMKGWNQSKNNTQLWMGLVIEVRFNGVKSNIA